MKIKIIADSSSDVLELKGSSFESVPLTILTDEKEYVDDSTLDVDGMVRDLKEYKGNLYIGSKDGSIFIVEGTNDNGEIINSYWTTPMDSFGYSNVLKTTNKRGGVARIKTIPNGKIKISERTNKKDERFITSKSSTGFDFTNIDFNNFSFTTKNESYIVYKIKEKKWLNISMKFYSDELDKPFGLYSVVLEAFVGGYAKR